MVILFLLCHHPPDNEKKINNKRNTLYHNVAKNLFCLWKVHEPNFGIIYVEKFLLKTIVVHKIKKINNGGCDEFLGF